MEKLDRPMGWDKNQLMDTKLKTTFKMMISMQMPQRQADPLSRWYFNEVLD
jgi:hypothetical protein